MGIIKYIGYSSDGSIRAEHTKELKRVKRYVKDNSKKGGKKATEYTEESKGTK